MSRCGDDKNTGLGVCGGHQGSARLTAPSGRASSRRWSHEGLRTLALRSQELTRRVLTRRGCAPPPHPRGRPLKRRERGTPESSTPLKPLVTPLELCTSVVSQR
ncbi:unnamed protein product [Rangifer tarandus platyrhynchus]|uniref:Uncharacterized protein n=1 Tax=Rangifer tarandus platyrhynchus TaxID=3082113 RepID=A0ABN9A117_RANTA|nr:unnamed protein product [Rangifer tarandus platyrhynchus]